MTKQLIGNEMFKPARKNFRRRRTVIKGLDDLWQIDLAELPQYTRENSGFKFILVVIDCFSKFLWTRKLKSKTAEEVSKAMADVLSSARQPKNLQSDAGKEFYNSKFKAVMTKHAIKHYSTFSVKKASMAERVIRTLKERLFKTFHLRGNYRWTNILQEITDCLNSSFNSTTKMKPRDFNKSNEHRLLKSVFNKDYYTHDGRNEKYQTGTVVRVGKEKPTFEKGYTPRWSTELFKIAKVQYTNPVTYLLEGMQGNPISGSFYAEEIQKTQSPDIYLVEKVLRRNGRKLYVKWLGLDKSHNSWIDSKDIN